MGRRVLHPRPPEIGDAVVLSSRAGRCPVTPSEFRRPAPAAAQFPPEQWPRLVVVMRDAVQSIWRAGERG